MIIKSVKFKEGEGKLPSYLITSEKYQGEKLLKLRYKNLVVIYAHQCLCYLSNSYMGCTQKSFVSNLVLKKQKQTQNTPHLPPKKISRKDDIVKQTSPSQCTKTNHTAEG